jgi:hypothetical protein
MVIERHVLEVTAWQNSQRLKFTTGVRARFATGWPSWLYASLWSPRSDQFLPAYRIKDSLPPWPAGKKREEIKRNFDRRGRELRARSSAPAHSNAVPGRSDLESNDKLVMNASSPLGVGDF